MNTQYKAVFHFYRNGDYENEVKVRFYDRQLNYDFKDAIISLFVKTRGEVVDETNDLLKDWNSEFGRTYPDKDGLSTEYAQFIVKKTRPFVDKVNKAYNLSKDVMWLDYEIIYEDEDETYPDFVFKVKLGNDIYGCIITLKKM